MELLTDRQLAFIFGLLGNVVSFLVFVAPAPTFYTIYKKKSSKGFHSIPYIVALSSAMLLLYYGLLKDKEVLLMTINSFGCAIEITYLLIYLIYAQKEDKKLTLKLIMVCNVGAFAVLALLVDFLVAKPKRVTVVGWISAAYSLAVFVAPLSIMWKVIKTKSVEYMPFLLSLALTLNAIMWFFYGLLLKDRFIASPNVLGFLFGVTQMVLYAIYKDSSKPEVKMIPTPQQSVTKEATPPSTVELAGEPTVKKGDECV